MVNVTVVDMEQEQRFSNDRLMREGTRIAEASEPTKLHRVADELQRYEHSAPQVT